MASTASIKSSVILGSIPDGLRNELIKSYNQILRNYRERRWEPSELNGGKFCEVVYTILRGYVNGSYPSKAAKPRNMLDACRALEQVSAANYPRSVRIQIPRMLISLYEIRNNRGVGHVSGDVDPNQMDAIAVLYMSKWILAELVRVFHNVDIKTAQAATNSITERVIPIVWEIDGKLRILDTALSMKDKTLVLLYHCDDSVSESDLVNWIEHSNPSVYRKTILRKSHKDKLIEFDESSRSARISPKGVLYVEELIASNSIC
jgi:hypothetical protein